MNTEAQIMRANVSRHLLKGYAAESEPYLKVLGQFDCVTGAPARMIADPPFMKSHPLGALLAGLALGCALGMWLGAESKVCPKPAAAAVSR